jgi:S1-C subfamily serine protease
MPRSTPATPAESSSGASAGIGFAIPVDEVNRIVPRLIKDGRITRPALGITAGPPGLTRALQLPAGVTVIEAARGSPAARAGLQPFRRARDGGILMGDVVTEVDGQPVANLDDVLTLLESKEVGDSVTLTIWNSGKTRKQRLELVASGT